MTHDGRKRTQAGGSPQKKLKATDPPLTVSDLNLCLGSRYCLSIGNPYEVAFERGSGCGGRCRTAKKAALKKAEAK
jgi:hypothetical protein